MTGEDKEYLISVIESQIARWCDYTGVGGDGVLATRIANALESEFAFVAYKENQPWANVFIRYLMRKCEETQTTIGDTATVLRKWRLHLRPDTEKRTNAGQKTT